MILFQQVTVSGNTHNNKSRGKKALKILMADVLQVGECVGIHAF